MPEQKGIIVIPVIIDEEKKLDDIKESEPFKLVIDVVKALATQDDRIVEYFRESETPIRSGGGIIHHHGFTDTINFTSLTKLIGHVDKINITYNFMTYQN